MELMVGASRFWHCAPLARAGANPGCGGLPRRYGVINLVLEEGAMEEEG